MIKKMTTAFVAVLLAACGGEKSPTDPDPPNRPDPVAAPEIAFFGVRVHRMDLEFIDSTEIAYGEAVDITWRMAERSGTNNMPDACTGTGGSPEWRRSLSVYGDTLTTGALTGPAEVRFTITCKNSAGSDEATVTVNVAAPGARMAISDRPDAVKEAQIKVLYILPKDAEIGNLVSDGWLQKDVDAMQSFLADEMGRMFRMDVFNGGDLDIATIRLHQMEAELAEMDHIDNLVSNRLQELGMSGENKTYLAYFHHECECGSRGGGNLAFVNLHPNVPLEQRLPAVTALHELFHTFGIVDENAPNYSKNRHTDGPTSDIMAGNGVATYHNDSEDAALDPGHDDYYCPEQGDCGENIADLHDQEADQHFTDPGSIYTGSSGSS